MKEAKIPDFKEFIDARAERILLLFKDKAHRTAPQRYGMWGTRFALSLNTYNKVHLICER